MILYIQSVLELSNIIKGGEKYNDEDLNKIKSNKRSKHLMVMKKIVGFFLETNSKN